ncbi:MAG: TonB-dependent receptor [Woeseiaceae bacterium]|nr:TonB-dependent receptor [Woeseiaceae bacterium]
MSSIKRLAGAMLTCPLAIAASLYVAPALAQDDADDVEEIVVTGSRIRRDEYTSAAPLQTYDIDAARKSGITTVSEMLQQSTITYGQQINAELNTNAGNSNASESPPLGGVGSANVGLRGLDPERTLVLLNSRRLGSSGVRGAPAQPDINLIPMTMVERVEVITEGASSVYGADAVAGVVNVILRNDFEGFEINAYGNTPQDDGGEVGQFSFMMGGQGDDTSFILGGEYFNRERIAVGDRADCMRLLRKSMSGEVFTGCSNGFFDNAIIDTGGLFGEGPLIAPNGDIFAYYTPGMSDTGVPDWSSTLLLPPCEAPLSGGTAADGFINRYTCDPRWHDEPERKAADLVQGMERFSLMMNGTWRPGWFGDEEVYVEAMYLNRQTSNRAATEQIFPSIPALIPQEDANGNIIVDGTGAPILVDNPMSPFPQATSVLVTLHDSLPQVRDVELQHIRMVGGVRGDFTAGWFGDNGWSWDGYVSYDRGVGFVDQPVMNENNLIMAVDTLRLDSTGTPICGINRPGGVVGNDLGFIQAPQACVPINWFAPSMFTTDGSAGGGFATQEEEDYLIANRTNRTDVNQFIAAAYITGEVGEIPTGGPIGVAFGLEYRKDEIDSATEFLGANGLVTAENPQQEGDSVGDRSLKEAYLEAVVPILVDMPGAELLEVEGALRFTEESNFGNETTGRFRATWRPIELFSLSGSYGTSFRAPNLREQFLGDQFSGTGGGTDPCVVPPAAGVGNVYNPALDNRPQVVIDNCIQSGADPTQLGLIATTTIPVRVGGNVMDLKPETSETFTATLQITPPSLDRFSFDFAISYFDILIEDTIRSIDPETIAFKCYNDAPNLSSPFCPRLGDRIGNDLGFNLIGAIDASFVNVGEETSVGWDFNARVTGAFGFGDVVWLNAATVSTERQTQVFEGDAIDDLKGTYGNPELRYNSNVIVNVGENWSFSWLARFIDETTAPAVRRTPSTGNCDDFEVRADLLLTTEATVAICDADSVWYHDISASYAADTWGVTAGIKNIADEQPPLITRGAGSNRMNRVTSSGYDQIGRQYFLMFNKSW